MSLSTELEGLDRCYERMAKAGIKAVTGQSGAPLYVLDFIAIGAIKRSISLASGVASMIRAKNMVCARALLRMHLDTVARFLAYTYVDDADADAVAKAVTGGAQLKSFKSSDGKRLTDAYLIARMSKDRPWVARVYTFTSGYVHFSERQFFDAVHRLTSEADRDVQFQISHVDNKFPESSWTEVGECFNQLTNILVDALTSWGNQKASYPPLNPSTGKR